MRSGIKLPEANPRTNSIPAARAMVVGVIDRLIELLNEYSDILLRQKVDLDRFFAESWIDFAAKTNQEGIEELG